MIIRAVVDKRKSWLLVACYCIGLKKGLTLTQLAVPQYYNNSPTSTQPVGVQKTIATLAAQHVNAKFNRLTYQINNKTTLNTAKLRAQVWSRVTGSQYRSIHPWGRAFTDPRLDSNQSETHTLPWKINFIHWAPLSSEAEGRCSNVYWFLNMMPIIVESSKCSVCENKQSPLGLSSSKSWKRGSFDFLSKKSFLFIIHNQGYF